MNKKHRLFVLPLEHSSALQFGSLTFDKMFLFLLIQDSVIPKTSKSYSLRRV